MFIRRKIKKLLYKKITRKNNLILFGDFDMTLGNKIKSTGNKDFYKSQDELMSFITELDLEEIWRRQNPYSHLYTNIHGRSNTYSCIDRAYASTYLRLGVKINHFK